MKRRSLLFSPVAAPFLIAASRDSLLVEDVRFVESSGWLRFEHSFPELLPTDEPQVIASLSSGFTTRLRYRFKLYKIGPEKVLYTIKREVKVHFDPWAKQYIVVIQDWRQGVKQRKIVKRLATKAAAIRNAIYVNVGVAPLERLQRGVEYQYYVHLFAERNPREASSEKSRSGRGQSRELSVFSRWINIFVPASSSADETYERRTNNVYLVFE